jgi:hypothetical protein
MIALNATIATRVTPKVREGGEGDEREGDGRFDGSGTRDRWARLFF